MEKTSNPSRRERNLEPMVAIDETIKKVEKEAGTIARLKGLAGESTILLKTSQ